MHCEFHLRRVSEQLRSLVVTRLAGGERPREIARQLESMGMRRRDARRFVAHVRRRSGTAVESIPGQVAHELSMVAAFGVAGLALCVLATLGMQNFTDGMVGFSQFGAQSHQSAVVAATAASGLIGVVVATIAYSMRSVTGAISALLGSATALYLLTTGVIG